MTNVCDSKRRRLSAELSANVIAGFTSWRVQFPNASSAMFCPGCPKLYTKRPKELIPKRLKSLRAPSDNLHSLARCLNWASESSKEAMVYARWRQICLCTLTQLKPCQHEKVLKTAQSSCRKSENPEDKWQDWISKFFFWKGCEKKHKSALQMVSLTKLTCVVHKCHDGHTVTISIDLVKLVSLECPAPTLSLDTWKEWKQEVRLHHTF